ncbi:AraC family transcriptional regulator [bacterium D16-51]|nr:AraC family transcriptional regulator [bacterium D16-59]RKI60281.1 AraC family transcriptional regulator [bacterium D16-51]
MESLPFEEGGILKMETKEILDDIVVYIEENIGGRLTVGELAAEVYISPAQLQRLFRMEFQMTVAEYVRVCKLKKALALLYETDRKVCDIAYDVGFEHESSFIRSFKREFGVTPHEARKHSGN